jgi:hypothetical protein
MINKHQQPQYMSLNAKPYYGTANRRECLFYHSTDSSQRHPRYPQVLFEQQQQMLREQQKKFIQQQQRLNQQHQSRISFYKNGSSEPEQAQVQQTNSSSSGSGKQANVVTTVAYSNGGVAGGDSNVPVAVKYSTSSASSLANMRPYSAMASYINNQPTEQHHHHQHQAQQYQPNQQPPPQQQQQQTNSSKNLLVMHSTPVNVSNQIHTVSDLFHEGYQQQQQQHCKQPSLIDADSRFDRYNINQLSTKSQPAEAPHHISAVYNRQTQQQQLPVTYQQQQQSSHFQQHPHYQHHQQMPSYYTQQPNSIQQQQQYVRRPNNGTYLSGYSHQPIILAHPAQV